MYIFSIEKFGLMFNIHETKHMNEVRPGENRKRNKHYTHEKLHEILQLAIPSITQFREKDISITFYNDVGSINSVLVFLKKDNSIIIKTALEHLNKQINEVFYNCERIYLRDYIFVRPTKMELALSAELKIVKKPKRKHVTFSKRNTKSVEVSETESDSFLKAMKNTKRI